MKNLIGAAKTAPGSAVSKVGWQPMSTAPKDGTMILLCESCPSIEPGGQVFPGCYLNPYGDGRLDWWAIHPTSRIPGHLYTPEKQEASDALRIPVDWRLIALTPLCWKPLPAPEEQAKLNRRSGQVLRHKFAVKNPPPDSQTVAGRLSGVLPENMAPNMGAPTVVKHDA